MTTIIACAALGLAIGNLIGQLLMAIDRESGLPMARLFSDSYNWLGLRALLGMAAL